MSGVGRKTSVYLTDDLAERVKESGVPLAELIRRGLDADGPTSLESTLARVVREQLEAWKGVPPLEKPAPSAPAPARRSRAKASREKAPAAPEGVPAAKFSEPDPVEVARQQVAELAVVAPSRAHAANCKCLVCKPPKS